MGLDDRDYMRERHRRTFARMTMERERPFTPPADSPPFLLKLLTWVAIGFVAYKAWGLWEANKAARRYVAPSVQVSLLPPASNAGPVQGLPAPPAPRVTSTAPAAPHMEAPRAAPRTGGTIYLCRAYGGGSFWASDHCNRHNALIDRMVSVPEGISFEQQVQIAEERRRALAADSPVQVTVSTPSPQAASNKALCESLDNRVTTLDAMARQPQSGSMQDWIRSERQKTRDEQFRLHC